MVRSCCVTGCNSKSHDSKGEKHGARFFSFPTWKKGQGQLVEDLTKRRRMAWVAAVGRENITFAHISPFMYVCCRHFNKGQPAYEMKERDPDWAPCLHLGHTEIGHTDTARSARQSNWEQLRKSTLKSVERRAHRAEPKEVWKPNVVHTGKGLIVVAKRRLELEDHEEVITTSCAKRASTFRPFGKGLSSPRCSRYNSSLCRLTQKFAQILSRSSEGVVDLNLAASELCVSKRRLYDISNVLEGVHLIRKKSKNNFEWTGCRLTVERNQVSYTIDSPEQQLENLGVEERKLDELIQSCTRQVHRLSEDKHWQRFAYLTYEDVKKVPSLREQTVLVVKAPCETRLEILHPEEGFQVYLSSSLGPIDVFLCSDDPDLGDAMSGAIGGARGGGYQSASADGGGPISPDSSPVAMVSSQDSATSSVSNGFSSPGARVSEHTPPVTVSPVPPPPETLTSILPPEDPQTFFTLTPPLALTLGGEDYLLSLGVDKGITDLFSDLDDTALPLI